MAPLHTEKARSSRALLATLALTLLLIGPTRWIACFGGNAVDTNLQFRLVNASSTKDEDLSRIVLQLYDENDDFPGSHVTDAYNLCFDPPIAAEPLHQEIFNYSQRTARITATVPEGVIHFVAEAYKLERQRDGTEEFKLVARGFRKDIRVRLTSPTDIGDVQLVDVLEKKRPGNIKLVARSTTIRVSLDALPGASEYVACFGSATGRRATEDATVLTSTEGEILGTPDPETGQPIPLRVNHQYLLKVFARNAASASLPALAPGFPLAEGASESDLPESATRDQTNTVFTATTIAPIVSEIIDTLQPDLVILSWKHRSSETRYCIDSPCFEATHSSCEKDPTSALANIKVGEARTACGATAAEDDRCAMIGGVVSGRSCTFNIYALNEDHGVSDPTSRTVVAVSPPRPIDIRARSASIELSFTPSPGATEYEIIVSETPGGDGSVCRATAGQVRIENGVAHISIGAGGLACLPALQVGKKYYVRVRSIAVQSSISPPSEEIFATPLAPVPSILARGHSGRVQLGWNTHASADGYLLYYTYTATPADSKYLGTGAQEGPSPVCVNPGPGVSTCAARPNSTGPGIVATAATGGAGLASGGALTADLTGLANGTTYTFNVTAFANRGASYLDTANPGAGDDGESDFTTAATALTLGMPANFAVSAGDGTVQLGWDPSSQADSYCLRYSCGNAAANCSDPFKSGLANRITDSVAQAACGSGSAASRRCSTLVGLVNGQPCTYVQVMALQGGLHSSDPTDAVTATPVSPPGGVTAKGGTNRIDVSWTSAVGAEAYVLYYDSDSPGPPYAGSKTVSGGASTTAAITGLSNGTTYNVAIRATNTTLGVSPYTTEVQTVTLETPALSTTAWSTSSVTLKWSAVTKATGYEVHYDTDSPDPPFTGSGATNGASPVAVTESAATSACPTGSSSSLRCFTLSGLTNGTTYHVALRATQTTYFATSSYSSTVSGAPLAAPTGLAVSSSAALGDTSATLVWTAVTGATGYRLYYDTDATGAPYAGTGATAGNSPVTLSGGTTTIADLNGLTPNTLFYFAVTATAGSSESAYSTELPSATRLSAPTNLQARGATTRGALSWKSVSGATQHGVCAQTTAGCSATVSASVSCTGPFDVICPSMSSNNCCAIINSPPLANGTQYYLSVRSEKSGSACMVSPPATLSNNCGFFASPEITATPIAQATPTPPGGQPATYATDDQITLDWDDIAGATYKVYYDTGSAGAPYTGSQSGGGTEPSPIALTASTKILTTLSANTIYFINITAVNTDRGESDYWTPTDLAQATTLPRAQGVTLRLGTGEGTITWSGVTGATGYEVYYGTGAGTPPDTPPSGIPASPAVTGSTNTTLGGLSNGAAHYVSIRGKSTVSCNPFPSLSSLTPGSNCSRLSTEVSGTPLAAVTGLSATPNGNRIDLAWSAVAAADCYKVYYVQSSTSPGACKPHSQNCVSLGWNGTGATDGPSAIDLASVTACTGSTTSYALAGLQTDLPYFVAVSAVKGSLGGGAYVTEADLTTVGPVSSQVGTPSGLTTTLDLGSNQFDGSLDIRACWNTVTSATSYKIYYDTDGCSAKAGFTGSDLGVDGGLPGPSPLSVTAQVGATQCAALSGGTNGLTYTVAVSAATALSESPLSSCASAAPVARPTGILMAPDPLRSAKVNIVPSGGTATLTFSWPPAGAIGTPSISTVAGTGTGGYSGDGGSATSAAINQPWAVALDTAGNIYIADRANHRVRKVTTAGTISTVAGNGTAGFSGDNGAATLANLNTPSGVALDSSGNLYIADQANHRIRKVDTTGLITTFAGTGTAAYSGDGGPATSAEINTPQGLAVDTSGKLYIADTSNYRIRMVNGAGNITTVAGNGSAGYTGDNGPATSATLNNPASVALDTAGNFYIADQSNAVIRKVSSASIITTAAGSGTSGYSGDGGPATSAKLNAPADVAVAPDGTLYIADTSNNRVREVSVGGTIRTAAGTGTAGFSGDGGLPTSAMVNAPRGVATNVSGFLYIADTDNNRIRGTGASNYKLKRDTDNCLQPFGTTTNVSGSSVTIGGLTTGTTYYFLLVAEIGGGLEVNYSDCFLVQPGSVAGDTEFPVGGQVAISWSAVTAASEYRLYYADATGPPYSCSGPPPNPSSGGCDRAAEGTPPITGLTATAQDLTEISPFNKYYLRLQAANVSGAGDYSNPESEVRPSFPVWDVPSVEFISSTSLRLKWKKMNLATDYELHYDTQTREAQLSSSPPDQNSTPYTGISGGCPGGTLTAGGNPKSTGFLFNANAADCGDTTPTDNNFECTLANLDPTCVYFFALRAISSGGKSAFSIERPSLRSPDLYSVIPATSKVTLDFSCVNGADQYNMLWGTAPGGPYTNTTSTANCNPLTADITNPPDPLTNGTTYYFVVEAENTSYGVKSLPSSEIKARPLTAPTLTSATGKTGSVDLTYTDINNGEDRYQIYYGLASGGPYDCGGGPCPAKTDPANPGFPSNVAATNGQTRYWTVKAIHSTENGASSFSNEGVATALAAPLNPVAGAAKLSVLVQWDPVTGASGYEIHYATPAGPPYNAPGSPKSVGTGSCAPTPCDDTITGLTAAVNYDFVVRATATNSASDFSLEVSAVPSYGELATAPFDPCPGSCSQFISSPAVLDLDTSDAVFEIIFGATNSSAMYIKKGNNLGTNLAGWPPATPPGAAVQSAPAVAELDASSVGNEVVIAGDDGMLRIYRMSGIQADAQAVSGAAGTSSPALADVDGNGAADLEIVLVAKNGATDSRLHLFDVNVATGALAEILVGFPIALGDLISTGSPPRGVTPALANLDGGADIEIVAGDASGRAHFIKGSGSETAVCAAFPLTIGGGTPINISPAVTDVDNDGFAEAVFANDGGNVISVNGPAGASPCAAGWTQNLAGSGPFRSSPVIADLDAGTPGREIVIAGSNGRLYVLKGTDGSSLNAFWTGGVLTSSPATAIRSSAAIADVNNDGDLEIVLADGNGQVHAYNWQDATDLAGFPTFASGAVTSSPSVGNFDNDPTSFEIAVGDDATQFHLYQVTGLAGIGATPWPTFHKNLTRTGN
ncbi:MAG: hypothetical protein HYY13_03320 [Nitrospirae bacterium]|nr:hypothetical protein [Nitrospirota bacterium]